MRISDWSSDVCSSDLVHHQYLCIGDRLADGTGAAVDFRRTEVGGAKGFGQAVHQIRLRPWKDMAQAFQERKGHVAAGVGAIAKRAAGFVGPVHFAHLETQRLPRSQAGDWSADAEA